MVTSLFVLDDIDAAAGATFVCPGTQRLRRKPNIRDPADRKIIAESAVPIVAQVRGAVAWEELTAAPGLCLGGQERAGVVVSVASSSGRCTNTLEWPRSDEFDVEVRPVPASSIVVQGPISPTLL